MQLEINERLLQTIHQLAEELGRSEEEVMETAVFFYMQSLRMLSGSLRPDSDIGAEIQKEYVKEPPSQSFEELFSRADRWQREQSVEPLADEEAMELANEELHAMRRERRSTR